uniref:Macaca fascicularis brain cDNA, clone: QflA-17315 n=1 Tax=Macaca fascicularis TaxID=9541 RepID=I7GI59_MACFA|nr:unnamed protein product [Macaca fascicularis]
MTIILLFFHLPKDLPSNMCIRTWVASQRNSYWLVALKSL